MSAYIRNFEIIPTIGSYIVDVDLGSSSVPLSGVVNFISLPGLTSFKMKNAAFERFENILSCSGLNVFDIADGHMTLNTVISCLSAFSDRKSILPEIIGNILLSGSYMPILLRSPEEGTLDYEFYRLYSYLKSEPHPWNVIVNLEPEPYFINLENMTLSLVTTGTRSSYVVVDNNINRFGILVNGYDGIYLNNYYTASALNECYITLEGTPQVTADTGILYVGQNATLSAIDGTLHTFYYFNTGSLLLGLGSKSLNLKPIKTKPVVVDPPSYVLEVPPRYGYIDGIARTAFNTNTLNQQTTYVILNTATKIFSFDINGVSVLSAYNWFFNTSVNTISNSYISITSVSNLQPSVKTLGFDKRVGLTAAGFEVYDIKYFYSYYNNKLTLAITRQNADIAEPVDYYDANIIIEPPKVEIIEPATTLPPESYIPPITIPGQITTPPPTMTEPPVITTLPPIVTTQAPTTQPPVTLTTTPPVVTITTAPPATTQPPFTVPPVTTTTPPATTAAPTTTPPPTTTTPPGPTTEPPPLTTEPPSTEPPITTPPPVATTTPPPITTTPAPTIPTETTIPPATSPPGAQTAYVEYEIVDTDINLSPPGEDIEIIN